MSIFRYASIGEITQLTLALVGLCFAFLGIWVAGQDAVELTDAPPSDWRRLIALGNLRGQLARLSAQGVLVYIGIVSILLPPPPIPNINDIAELQQSGLVRIGLILVTAILTADMFLERRQRITFMEKTRKEHPETVIPKTDVVEEKAAVVVEEKAAVVVEDHETHA